MFNRGRYPSTRYPDASPRGSSCMSPCKFRPYLHPTWGASHFHSRCRYVVRRYRLECTLLPSSRPLTQATVVSMAVDRSTRNTSYTPSDCWNRFRTGIACFLGFDADCLFGARGLSKQSFQQLKRFIAPMSPWGETMSISVKVSVGGLEGQDRHRNCIDLWIWIDLGHIEGLDRTTIE